jgi:hypothetical protein
MEAFEPRTSELAAKYDIIELNTCVKPRVFEYLFVERGADRVVYLDPDIRVFAPLTDLERTLDGANVALTPHLLTPPPRDGKVPSENGILPFGIYNLGFIGMKRSDESIALARWWMERTYTAGYIRPDQGMFVDQIYANLMPVFFKGVTILEHPGYNMAPWNLHERVLNRDAGTFRVNGKHPLTFFHFSSFKLDSGELPTHKYTRYTMSDRPDLVSLYAEYNADLKAAGHERYSQVPWAYRAPVVEKPYADLRRKVRKACRTGVMWGVGRLPASVRELGYQVFRAARD